VFQRRESLIGHGQGACCHKDDKIEPCSLVGELQGWLVVLCRGQAREGKIIM